VAPEFNGIEIISFDSSSAKSCSFGTSVILLRRVEYTAEGVDGKSS